MSVTSSLDNGGREAHTGSMTETQTPAEIDKELARFWDAEQTAG